MRHLIREFTKGITLENPTFCLILGLCPTLAVSTSLINAVGMGVATTFVLVGSNVIVSTVRNIIPDKIRLPAFIVIIATFVTISEMVMQAYLPELNEALGIFVPLIVVNCIILGRAEAFASKNPVIPSLFDGLGMGIGFTLGLSAIALVREVLGAGSIFGIKLLTNIEPITMMILSPGALLTLGLLIAFVNLLRRRHKNKLSRTGGDSS